VSACAGRNHRPAVLRKARGWGLTTSQHGGDGRWRKSSLSGANTDCLEVCFTGGTVRVRHSKHPGGQIIGFSRPEWRAFLAAVRWGEFD
jgi:hypothetical protein